MMKQFTSLIIFCAALLMACDSPGPKVPNERVSVQLKWLHSAQFAGFYVAQQRGYYADEGIEVELRPGGIKTNTIDEVATGSAQFGIWPGDSLLIARTQGKSVKAIGVTFQLNPTAYFSLAEKGIESPADFKGKRIAYSEKDYLFRTVLGSAGLTLDDIEPYPFGFDLTPLLEGDVDVWTGYLTNQVANLRAEGYQLNVVLAYDHRAFIYSDVLFTTSALIENNPDLVRGFMGATLRGWAYALAHPNEAVDAVMHVDPTLDRAQVERAMVASIPLIESAPGELGRMNDTVWRSTHTILLENGLLDSPVDVRQIYTNEFIPALN